jgi:hypothetical protein
MDNILIYSARPPERAAPFDNGRHPKPYTNADMELGSSTARHRRVAGLRNFKPLFNEFAANPPPFLYSNTVFQSLVRADIVF